MEGGESIVYTAANLFQTHTFYQPSWLSIKGGTSYSFSGVRQAQKPFSSKLQLPPHLLKPACWRRNVQTVTCLRSIGCCCSCALVDGLFKRLHMLVEGKAAEYIKQLSEPLCGPAKSKWNNKNQKVSSRVVGS